MRPQQILLAPVVTERATSLTADQNKVTFRVPVSVNKYQIRDAVRAIYGVQVDSVHTAVQRGKLKRRGKSLFRQSPWKKAVVRIRAGETIDFFAAE